jgi:putative ABC transport system permease protein
MGSSLRALVRVARSDITRHRGRSLLVIALVALPVAAMVFGTSLYKTTTPTEEASATAQFGRADLIAYNKGPEALDAYLPNGSVVEPTIQVEDRLVLPGARTQVSLRAMNLDGLAAGMLTVVDGRTPKGTDEAAITQAVADAAKVSIGGSIELEHGGTRRVVGLIENPGYLAEMSVVIDPVLAPSEEDFAIWLIGLPPGTDPEAIVQATMLDPSVNPDIQIMSRQSTLQQFGDSVSPTILILGSLALVEASLIASAAFAVSIRRRQRELGLLAATGATPRQLAGTVLAGGAILGVAACVVGVVVGLAAAFAISPWLDQLTQRRNPPLVVDVASLVGPVIVGFVAALIAALVPARTVSRVPVLLALSGRRPTQAPARRSLALGIVLIVVAAAMTVVGTRLRDHTADAFTVPLLVGGAVISVLGFGAIGPWLLERLDGLAKRLPLASRIAFRDTARSRSRSSPIVTAILAGCAAAVALGALQASRDEESLRGWRPSIYADELAIQGPNAKDVGEVLAGESGALAGALMTYYVPADPNIFVRYQLPDAKDDDGKLINLVDQCVNCYENAFEPYEVYRAAPARPEIMAMANVGSVEADLAAGRAVVLTYRASSATKLEIVAYPDVNDPSKVERVTLPVRLIRVDVPGGRLPDLFLPPSAIAQLGLHEITAEDVNFEPASYVVRYDRTVTTADLEHAREVASRYPDTIALIDTPPTRQGAEFRIALMALVLLFAVSVTGIAIALGEAESRPEQRSLLAIGADPRLRRRIAAARAAVLALLAGLLAVPAGLLPIWGIFATRGSPLVVPSIEIAGAVLALPILAVLASFLLSRPIPDWGAFRSVRPGE